MVIIRWPHHVRHVCRVEHEDGGWSCPFCNGGLYLCRVCGGAEADLPSECPGARMHEDERTAVANGHLDYVGGAWVTVSEEAQRPVDRTVEPAQARGRPVLAPSRPRGSTGATARGHLRLVREGGMVCE